MPLSGEDVLRLYRKAGWVVLHRKGSHLKVGKNDMRETIPMHKELGRGIERKLLKRLARSRTDEQGKQ